LPLQPKENNNAKRRCFHLLPAQSKIRRCGAKHRNANSWFLTNANGKSRTLSVYKDEWRDESAARK